VRTCEVTTFTDFGLDIPPLALHSPTLASGSRGKQHRKGISGNKAEARRYSIKVVQWFLPRPKDLVS